MILSDNFENKHTSTNIIQQLHKAKKKPNKKMRLATFTQLNLRPCSTSKEQPINAYGSMVPL